MLFRSRSFAGWKNVVGGPKLTRDPDGLWAEIRIEKDSSSGLSILTTNFYCLPDTVDPRGPKGTK